MEKPELQEILKLHAEWLLDSQEGRRADLQGANLQDADLRGEDLQGASLQDADLQGANLRDADLQGADLQGAGLDYSCFPLWCGSKKMKVDMKFVYQLLAHVYALDCSSEEFAKVREAIKPFAEKSHRWNDLVNGLL